MSFDNLPRRNLPDGRKQAAEMREKAHGMAPERRLAMLELATMCDRMADEEEGYRNQGHQIAS